MIVDKKKPQHVPYVHQDFPTYRYHPDGRAMKVLTPEQLSALPEEWRDTPYRAKAVQVKRSDITEAEAEQAIQAALDEQKAKFSKAYGKLEADYKTLSESHSKLLDEHNKLVQMVNQPPAQAPAQSVAESVGSVEGSGKKK